MVDREIARYKDRGGKDDEEQVRIYVESVLANEAVLQFLEKIAHG